MASKKETLKRLKSDRTQLDSQLERFLSFINNCDALTNKIHVNERFVRCESLWKDFDKIQLEIEFLDDSNIQKQERIDFENKYFECICKFKEFQRGFVHQNTSSTSNIQNAISQISVTLKPLDLPEFYGNYDSWVSFFDTFIALVHNNTSMADVQKFHYLKGCLKGNAAQVIQSLEPTDSNYEIAFKLLRERYENKKLIIQSHIKALFDYPPMAKTYHKDLRNFLDTIQKNYRALKALKEPIETWDTILLYLFNTKLDPNSKREWEMQSIIHNTIKYGDFIKFLQTRCQVLESLDSSVLAENKIQHQVNKNKNFLFNSTKSMVSLQNQKSCKLCNNGQCHPLYYCCKFLSLNESQRGNEVRRLHLCLNCFKEDHMSTRCPVKGCNKCGKPHNTLLHINYNKSNNSINMNTPQAQIASQITEHSSQKLPDSNSQNKINNQCNVVTNNSKSVSSIKCSREMQNGDSENHMSITTVNSDSNEVLLSTARVLISGPRAKKIEVRALLDSGSQSNLMTEKLCKKLNFEYKENHMSVFGINNYVTKSIKSVTATIESNVYPYSTELEFHVLPKILGSQLPVKPINRNSLKIPCNIKLADNHFDTPAEIDILLGVGIFYELLCRGQIKIDKGMPIFQSTKLGWIISGEVPTTGNQNNKNTICNLVSSFKSLEEQVQRMWEIDEIQPCKILKKEEKECEELYLSTTKHAEDGKFIVELPTKNGIENLGDSREMAIKRFQRLEKKLENNEEVRRQYIKFMREYEELGHMTVIQKDEVEQLNKIIYYLPHHPVIKEESLSTKLRVVFDASAKTDTGISLNDKLKCGPIIQDELFSMLLRFRKYNIVIGADIEKMYRQVWVSKEQRDLQRIVWRENRDRELKHYRLNTVTYGTTSASYLAIRSLHMAAEEAEIEYPKACSEIKKNFYVDDLLTGANTIEEAIEMKNNITIVLDKCGFKLRKWMSNKKEMFGENTEVTELYIIDQTVAKTLGLSWNIIKDKLQYKIEVGGKVKPTKRNILSIISKVFDPLGLIGPLIIRAKIILQEIWKHNLDWDQTIPNEIYNSWIQFYTDLPKLNNLRICRQVVISKAVQVDLHGFCDSSERAYGACIYVRSVDDKGKISVCLLCAKAKVAPKKTLTLPRLELCGALILTRLMKKVLECIDQDIQTVTYWSDSKIVLAWLRAEPASWNVFVAHRIAEIQQYSDIKNWNHIATQDNPADLITRGCDAESLIRNELWWHGPNWLLKNKMYWPISNEKINVLAKESLPEIKNRKVVCMVMTYQQDIFYKFSTFSRLQRVVAYIQRFFNNCKNSNKKDKVIGSLKLEELDNALVKLIKIAQYFEFSSEIKALERNDFISNNSKIASLRPFLDHNGILRVGGRIGKSSVDFNTKHPAILQKNHVFSKLVILHEHKRNLHMGPQNLLSNIRSRFWILGGINFVKKVLRSCVTCFRVKPKGINTLMGELPEQRLSPTKPFHNCGIDYAGPFRIKSSTLRNAKVLKAYLCVFICFVTRAVHLEIVSDLTTESFLNALKRFIARRGKVQNIYSDCGSNFVGANHEMQDFKNMIIKNSFQSQVVCSLSQEGIKWNFIPSRSPHFGGLWESCVKQAKYYLKRTVGNALLTFEELATIFAQIEACINSRPLSPLSSDINDLNPLTPGHFLVGDSLVALPETDVRELSSNRLNRYQYLKKIVQNFWDRWYKEVLTDLNKRNKWHLANERNLKEGDMVLLREDNLPPLKWALGRVEQLFYGTDNIVRVVAVKTSTGVFRRAVAKLCLLPSES